MAIDNYTDQPATYKDIALDLAARGWLVFPLAPKSKDPDGILAPQGLKNATTDSNQIRTWWSARPAANIGIATGAKSGIIVLDLDNEQALDEATRRGLPPTASAKTSQGYHVYFKHPGRPVKNRVKFLPGMDFRGDGGYVVAPPSVHPDGPLYRWEVSPDEAVVADPPAWLLDVLSHKPSTPPAPPNLSMPNSHDEGALTLLTACLNEVRQAPEGQRNDTLNHAAYTLGGLIGAGRLDRTETETALLDAARTCGLGEREALATITSGLNAGAAAPLPSRERPSLHIVRPREKSQAPPDQPDRGFNNTDLGNAERLVSRHGPDLRYCHVWGKWLAWDGRRWTVDATGEVERRAKETVRNIYAEAAAVIGDDDESRALRKAISAWAHKSEARTRIEAMISLAASEPGIPVTPRQLDADPWLFNCLNGTVDLRANKLRPHAPTDLITRLAPVEYHPDARSETWEKFLAEATGSEELAAFLRRAVGYSLTGSTDEEVLFFIHGPAAAGKSTFAEAIKDTLGDYASTTDFETLLWRPATGGPRNDIARLDGARLVCSIEVDEGKRLAEGLVKMLTGGDRITARFLYHESFEFTPAFKLWLVANHPPRVDADDDAMWRRILRLPFEQVVPKARRDPHLKVKLRNDPNERAAILAWAVRGCLEWQHDGLGVPPIVEQATQAYREEMDPLKDFIVDCCVIDPQAWASAKALREGYVKWCEETGQKPVGDKLFGKSLRTREITPHLQRTNAGVTRGWKGIGLRTTD